MAREPLAPDAPKPAAASESRIRAIHFFPVDGLAAELGERIVALVSRHVSVPCRFVDARLNDELHILPGREQADVNHLLTRLEEHTVPAGVAVVGITTADLGLPIFTFVFGGARNGGHTAAVSLARLQPEYYGLPADPGLTALRAVAETLHEVGHVAGLGHCERYDCLMYRATSVEAIDLRGLAFCPSCAAALPWLRQAIGQPMTWNDRMSAP